LPIGKDGLDGQCCYYLAIGGVLCAASCARALAMRPAYIDEIKWYTIGLGILAGTCLLWAWSEAGDVPQQRVLLGVIGAIFGSFLLIFIGELIRPTSLAAQSTNEARPNSNSATSTGQSGGMTAGTINIFPPPQVNNQKTIDQIASLMDQGSTIASEWERTNDTDALKRDIVPWMDAVYKYISGTLGVSYAIQFKNTHEVSAVGLNGHSVEGMGYWHEILGKVKFLNELIDALRK
jgi:hypothetical protein